VSSHVFVLEVSVLTHVPRQVSEQSCICVLEVSVLTHVPRQVSDKTDTSNTQIHDCSLTSLGT
jgi:hypothetical protein